MFYKNPMQKLQAHRSHYQSSRRNQHGLTGIPATPWCKLFIPSVVKSAWVRGRSISLAAIADTPQILMTISNAHIYTERVSASLHVNAAPGLAVPFGATGLEKRVRNRSSSRERYSEASGVSETRSSNDR
jgi:hypothetical protein